MSETVSNIHTSTLSTMTSLPPNSSDFSPDLFFFFFKCFLRHLFFNFYDMDGALRGFELQLSVILVSGHTLRRQSGGM